MSSQSEDQENANIEMLRRIKEIDNFKDHPQTIGEIRSDKSDNARDWSPRDALITLLRRIDNGLDVHSVVISYADTEEGEYRVHYLASSASRGEALGLITRVTWLMNEAM